MGIQAKIAEKRRRVNAAVIAGGGTGGHLFPGIAVAEELKRRQPGSRVVFVSSGRPLEERVLSAGGFEKAVINVEGIKGRRQMAKLKSSAMLPFGFLQAMGLLRRVRPDVVIGMGGYSAGPVILGAWMLSYPRVICEQNRLPGATNRILSRFAQKIYVAYPDTFGGVSGQKVLLTGNPVRRQIIDALLADENGGPALPDSSKTTDSRELPAPTNRFTVLILGGSQGAHGLNLAINGALDYLSDKENYHFIHQSGQQDAADVAAAYEEKGFLCTVAPFFEDMAGLYRRADLVICRSGATTVAEIAVAGKAAIFVPFPHATDDHQRHNARHLADVGAAGMILEKDLSARVLAESITFYQQNPEALRGMKAAMKGFGRPDAAEKIVDDIEGLLGMAPSTAGAV